MTIYGNFFTSDAAQLEVSFGAFPCSITGVTADGDGTKIECVTSASGTTDGGAKYVTVTTQAYGSSLASANHTFEYIDAWSARTTWGGGAPPTGCGSWYDDPLCTGKLSRPAPRSLLAGNV